MEDFDRTAYERATQKAKAIKSFYVHLTFYLTCMPIVIIINLVFSPQFHWFWFSLVGWGLSILAHGYSAFESFPFLGRKWEERKLKELMEKEKTNRWE